MNFFPSQQNFQINTPPPFHNMFQLPILENNMSYDMNFNKFPLGSQFGPINPLIFPNFLPPQQNPSFFSNFPQNNRNPLNFMSNFNDNYTMMNNNIFKNDGLRYNTVLQNHINFLQNLTKFQNSNFRKEEEKK